MVDDSLNLISSHLGLINVKFELATRLVRASLRQNRKNYLKIYSLLKQRLTSFITQEQYDVILIDCPPNFNIVTQNALVASDYYLVPARADYLSTLGIEQFKKQVFQLVRDYNHYVEEKRKELNPSEQPTKIFQLFLGIIFTMISYSKQQPISVIHHYKEEVKKQVHPIFESMIRENKTIFADSGKQ